MVATKLPITWIQKIHHKATKDTWHGHLICDLLGDLCDFVVDPVTAE